MMEAKMNANQLRVVQIQTKAMARVLARNGAGHKLFEMDIRGVSVTVATPLNAEINIEPDERTA